MFLLRKSTLILSFLILTCFAISECQVNISGFDLSWQTSSDSVEFVYKTDVSQSDNVWIAFGFSNDPIMVYFISLK